MCVGYIPIESAALLGAHTPDGLKQFGYRTPSAANLLNTGVVIVESPKGGITGLRSSVTSHNILGLKGVTNLLSGFT
jgi:hypothetical protein